MRQLFRTIVQSLLHTDLKWLIVSNETTWPSCRSQIVAYICGVTYICRHSSTFVQCVWPGSALGTWPRFSLDPAHLLPLTFNMVGMPQTNTVEGIYSEYGSQGWPRSTAAKYQSLDSSRLQCSSGPLSRPNSVGSQLKVVSMQGERIQLLPKMETKLYRRRWLMLFIFSVTSASNGSTWLQYSIISDIFMRFYNVDSQTIDWLSLISLLIYVLLFLPVLWLLDKRGLREVVLVGAAFNCIGSCIKIGSADPKLFTVTFVGQLTTSTATVVFLSIPSYFASVWFGESEVSTACSIGVLGSQVCLNVHYWPMNWEAVLKSW